MVPTADMPKSPFKRRRYSKKHPPRPPIGLTLSHLEWHLQANYKSNYRSNYIICKHSSLVPLRSMNEIKNLHYLPRTSEPREVLFEDRTRAHADHVGQSFDWQSTAAVGVLKAVQFGEW